MLSPVSNPTPLVTLADLTGPELIVPHLSGRDVAGVIQELSQTMQRAGRVPNLLPFFHAALNREFLVSTEMAAGMAFPHARLPGLAHLTYAFGRLDEPLVWSARTSASVRLIFLIAVPATDSIQYLHLISGLARLSQNSQFLARLHKAQDTFQILDVLQQVQFRNSSSKPC